VLWRSSRTFLLFYDDCLLESDNKVVRRFNGVKRISMRRALLGTRSEVFDTTLSPVASADFTSGKHTCMYIVFLSNRDESIARFLLLNDGSTNVVRK
jgi:hypothetical protein